MNKQTLFFSLQHTMNLSQILFSTFLLITFSFNIISAQTIRYVTEMGSGTHDGSSWANASHDLQATIDASYSGDEVWVASGIYKPTYFNDPSISFSMKSGVNLYGGFEGHEASIFERPTPLAPTILSGEIGFSGYNDNSYHVIRNFGVDNAILDGFTISDGNAHGGWEQDIGGGILNLFSSLTISNCTFVNNRAGAGTGILSTGRGGAIYNKGGAPIIMNCSFSNNTSKIAGGAIENEAANTAIDHCSFINNEAYFSGTYSSIGGAISINAGAPSITNCYFESNHSKYGGAVAITSSTALIGTSTFYGNSAERGAGIYSAEEQTTILNSLFYENQSSISGAGVYTHDVRSKIINSTFHNNYPGYGSTVRKSILTNCIVWGNNISPYYGNSELHDCIVSYSIIGGGHAGTANIDANPLFVAPESYDFHLDACSPAIDAGTETGASPLDLDGNTRVDAKPNIAGIVDIGAYEYQSQVGNITPIAMCKNTTIEVQADGTYTLQENDVFDATNSSAYCGIDHISFASTIYTCDDVGLIFPEAVTLVDASGNTDDCTAYITVELGNNLPNNWNSNDIGTSPDQGQYGFNPCSNTVDNEFTLITSANNTINPTNDNIAFAYQAICSDVIITAKIENLSPNAYAGLMIRESSNANSKQVAIFSNLSNSLRHEARYITGANKVIQNFIKPAPLWLRLQRQGNWVFAFYSTNGMFFQYVHAVYIPLNNCIEIGLASFTYLPNTQTEATFSHVNISGGMMPYVEIPEITATATIKPAPSLYPNPASNLVNLVFEDGLDKNASVILRNQLGQVIEQRELRAGDFNTEWNVSTLVNGLYFFEIRQEGEEAQVLKLVKTR